jgi:hypothetical protein
MPWAMLAVSLIGLLLGIRLRVPALVFAAMILVVAGIGFGQVAQWSLQRTALSVLAALVVLNCTYLVGLCLSFAFTRLKSRKVMENSDSSNG